MGQREAASTARRDRITRFVAAALAAYMAYAATRQALQQRLHLVPAEASQPAPVTAPQPALAGSYIVANAPTPSGYNTPLAFLGDLARVATGRDEPLLSGFADAFPVALPTDRGVCGDFYVRLRLQDHREEVARALAVRMQVQGWQEHAPRGRQPAHLQAPSLSPLPRAGAGAGAGARAGPGPTAVHHLDVRRSGSRFCWLYGG